MREYVINKGEFDAASTWSISNALHMMKLSYAIYAGTTDEVGSSENWSITEKLVSEAGYEMRRIEATLGIYDPNAMICWDQDNLFLIFRGTEPTAWNQWLTDFLIKKVRFCTGKAHQGFLKAVDLIWPKIVNCLQEVDPEKRKRLFVGGHSLGAGMSQVASARLASTTASRVPEAVYNFGCPRALDSAGARAYNERLGVNTFRVVNNNDLVCSLPPEWLGFSHVGQLRYLTSGGDVLENPTPERLHLEAALGKIRALAKLKGFDFVSDHLPHHYAKQLTVIAGQAAS